MIRFNKKRDSDKIIQIDNTSEIKKELTSRFIKSIHQSLLKKKYGTKVDNFNGIGKRKVNEYLAFPGSENLEKMYELDNYFFVDNEVKDNLDLWDQVLDNDINFDEIW